VVYKGISTVITSPAIPYLKPENWLEISVVGLFEWTHYRDFADTGECRVRERENNRQVCESRAGRGSVKVKPVALKLLPSVLKPSLKPNSLPPTIVTVGESWLPGEFW
jgi:hypothetical protein